MGRYYVTDADGEWVRVQYDDGEPECCACRWVKGYGDCGHGESPDGITSPHVHCEEHVGGAVRTALESK